MDGQDFIPIWENYLQKLNLTGNSIVLFQTGAHAVANHGINNAIGPEFDIYLNALVNIKRHADKMGFKMVVLTSLPFPDHDRSDRRLRPDKYALAALSRLLQDKLSLSVALKCLTSSELSFHSRTTTRRFLWGPLPVPCPRGRCARVRRHHSVETAHDGHM